MSDAPRSPSLEEMAAELEKAAAKLNVAQKRHERERKARQQAEALLEDRAHELYEANERLARLNGDLERRVEIRTSELDEARRQALKLAELDQLTGLANRRSFVRKLEIAIELAHHMDQKIAILSLDLDFFKDINDTLGHHAGDEVLKQVAKRLIKIVRTTDLVARLGGDEFAIICPINKSPDEIAYIADRVIDALNEPVLYEDKPLEVSCSIGVAVDDGKSANSHDLQRFADIALYFTKARGRGDWSLYEESMGESVKERQKLSHHLRRALENGGEGLEVRYQPIVDLNSGAMVAVEALCRWTDPVLGPISPEEFIPVAEETSLVYELGDYVLNQSCAELKDWLNSNKVHLAINLSPKQLKDRHLMTRVSDAIQKHGVSANHLCFEVTESLFLWDITEAQNRLNELSNLGAKIALDDFGTGFSNLGQLRMLPVDYLKIDRTFVSDIEYDERALAMVQAILAMANGMGIQTVAEGVENKRQATLLKNCGGEFAQGYFFAAPLTLHAFYEFASQRISNPVIDLSTTNAKAAI